MIGAKMKPLNRRLLIEVLNQEEEQSGAFFVATVVDCATDCTLDLTGKKIVFTTFGMETITLDGKQYNFIGENHLICTG